MDGFGLVDDGGGAVSFALVGGRGAVSFALVDPVGGAVSFALVGGGGTLSFGLVILAFQVLDRES